MMKKKLSRELRMLNDDRKFWARNKRAAKRMFSTETTNRTSNRTTTRNDFKLSTITISNDNRTRTMAISNGNRKRTVAVSSNNWTRTMVVSNNKRTRTTKNFRTTVPVRLLPCTGPNITPTIPIIDGRSKTVSQAVTFFILGSIALAFLYFLVRNAMTNIPSCRQLVR